MLRRTAVVLVLAATVLSISSCRKLETPAASGKLPHQTLANATTLPADWGNLVSVTNAAFYPDLLQLWFQDRDGNVRMVVYSLSTSGFLHATLVRRQ
jgi:hypothetical protein